MEIMEGVQGSGKSYRLAHKIYHQGHQYARILTNLDGIKTDTNIHLLDVQKFISHIEYLFIEQTQKALSFRKVVEIMKDREIIPHDAVDTKKVLVVVDEAQNFFGKQSKGNPALVWLVTQHRHLHIDLQLITQKTALLRPEYIIVNAIYRAFPPSKQLRKGYIRYKEFVGYPLNKDNELGNFSLPIEQEVFELYHSGDRVKSPNVVKKLLSVTLIPLSIIIVSLYFAYSLIGTESESIPTEVEIESNTTSTVFTKQPIQPILHHKVVIENSITTKQLYTAKLWDDGYFTIDSCSMFATEKPISIYKYIISQYGITPITATRSYQLTIVYFFADSKICGEEREREENEVSDSIEKRMQKIIG